MSHDETDPDLLAADDAAEEIIDDDDLAMDSDEELVLHNDSIAYFDLAQDSLFAIAQHPQRPSLIAVGGSAGPSDDAPGAGWVFDTSAAPSRPLLPPSYAATAPTPSSPPKSTQLHSVSALDGHSDSINALAWTQPAGAVLVSGGLDGRLRAWRSPKDGNAAMTLLGEAQEVDEVNWIAACPAAHPDVVAVGASNGSVWVYDVGGDSGGGMRIVRSYFLHTASCTAGAWTRDGRLLATVSEDGSLYVWDVWGGADQPLVSQTGRDQRFEVEGGLYSVAVDPRGAFVAVGGAGGAVRIVSLPGGQVLAALQAQGDSIETLATTALTSTTPGTTLLAAGSVDGSVCVYDASRSFAVRKMLVGAHGDHSVVKVEFVPGSWLLTTCGMDGVVRRWDLRAGAADAGPQREWRGHLGGGEGGGVLGFVQGSSGERIVTAGDDGVALVFEA